MDNKEVLVNLYEFLKKNETGLYKVENDTEVRAYVLVDFHDLKEFSEIAGESFFDDGGIDVRMFSRYVAIELNELFEAYGHCISNYKNCFDKDAYENYEAFINQMEA